MNVDNTNEPTNSNRPQAAKQTAAGTRATGSKKTAPSNKAAPSKKAAARKQTAPSTKVTAKKQTAPSKTTGPNKTSASSKQKAPSKTIATTSSGPGKPKKKSVDDLLAACEPEVLEQQSFKERLKIMRKIEKRLNSDRLPPESVKQLAESIPALRSPLGEPPGPEQERMFREAWRDVLLALDNASQKG
ncbi:MAG: hypothetical protein QOF53_3232 [Nocardioidaceae bacterium]|nr:hypothetical protein [Nocardioidaceae bacterium]